MRLITLFSLLFGFYANAEILTPQQIQSLSNNSVVRLAIVNNGQILSTGSAFSVNETQGVFVTNYHVAGDAITKGMKLMALESMSPKKWHSATILAYSKIKDLAIIKINNWHKEALILGDDNKVHKSSKAFSLGFPGGGDEIKASVNDFVKSQAGFGVISALKELEPNGGKVQHFQHDVTINPGNSGGPLINECGELIGINVLGVIESNGRTVQNVYFAITVNELKSELNKHNIQFKPSNIECKSLVNIINEIKTKKSKWFYLIISLIIIALLVLVFLYFKLVKKVQSGEHINSAFIERLVLSKIQKNQQIPAVEKAKSTERTLAIEVVDGNKNKKKYQLPLNKEIVVGRAKNKTHIYIDNPYLSKKHAVLLFKENKLFVKDLNSKNHTIVDNKIIDNQWLELIEGQIVTLASKITIKKIS